MKSLVLAAAGVIGFALVDLSLFKTNTMAHKQSAVAVENEFLREKAKKKRRKYKNRKYKKFRHDKRKAPHFKQ